MSSSYMRRYAALALLATELLAPTEAITFHAEHRHTWRSSADVSYLRRRDTVGQVGQIQVQDLANAQYVTNVTVNGANFFVTMDTGSSDLNIEGTVPSAQDTNIQIEVDFAIGAEVGVMSFGTVEFAGHTVQKQIFNHVAQVQEPPVQGLVGLGPSIGSDLWFVAQPFISNGSLSPSNAGDSLLDRIFQENTSTPNFISFTLGREDDPNTSNTNALSTFTVGDYIPGYENISTMPQLDVINAPTALQTSQHFTIAVDGFAVSGQSISFPSSVVKGVGSGKLVAVLDSGFTLPQVVPAISDALYKNVPGAVYKNISLQGSSQAFWVLPCGAEIDASFTFAGHTYPLHPLDVNFDASFIGLTNRAQELCIGAFQPIQDDATEALAGLADMILGAGFLRNTYTLMNYGDFVDSNADVRQAPFVQLLPITDPTQASKEFHQVRGGTAKTFSGDTPSGSSGSSSNSNNSNNQTFLQKNLPIIIAIPCVIAIMVLGGIAAYCIRRRNQNKRYQTLNAPAPYAAGQMAYAPYQPYGGQRGMAAGAAYDDPFRDTSGPEEADHIPLAERNAAGRFAPPPGPAPPNRNFTPSPQPPRGYTHSPQPGYPNTAPYDPPRGLSPQPPYTAPAPYDPPVGPPPGNPFR